MANREYQADRASWAASKFKALEKSNLQSERANAYLYAIISRVWQLMLANPDGEQANFDSAILEWHEYCLDHYYDGVQPNFFEIMDFIYEFTGVIDVDDKVYHDLLSIHQNAVSTSEAAVARKEAVAKEKEEELAAKQREAERIAAELAGLDQETDTKVVEPVKSDDKKKPATTDRARR